MLYRVRYCHGKLYFLPYVCNVEVSGSHRLEFAPHPLLFMGKGERERRERGNEREGREMEWGRNRMAGREEKKRSEGKEEGGDRGGLSAA